MEKLRIDRPIIVEGKYDKIALSAVIDATVLTTGGFSLFKNKERVALLRRLAAPRGVILLTDADGAGKHIRAFLSSHLPAGSITHLYTPAIEGKEKRKQKRSKEGLLGVEGMGTERLRALFAPFATDAPLRADTRPIGKLDFYGDGLSGGENASEKRNALAALFDLPHGMSANALLAALNLLAGYDEYRAAVDALTRAGGLSSVGGAENGDAQGENDDENDDENDATTGESPAESGADAALYNIKEGSGGEDEE